MAHISSSHVTGMSRKIGKMEQQLRTLRTVNHKLRMRSVVAETPGSVVPHAGGATPPPLPGAGKGASAGVKAPQLSKQSEKPVEKSVTGQSVLGVEKLLSRSGIALLIVGVLVLFKYSLDQGWLQPPLRIGFGMVLGLGLLLAGRRFNEGRVMLGQLMTGGGLAVLFLTIYAAAGLYELLPGTTALVFVLAVMVLGFKLAAMDRSQGAALVALLGGSMGPLMLEPGRPTFVFSLGYVSIISLLAASIHLRAGWNAVLGVGALTGFALLWWSAETGFDDVAHDNRFLLQGAVLVWWVSFGVLPLLRQWLLLAQGRPSQAWRPHGVALQRLGALPHVVMLLAPVLAVFASVATWDLGEKLSGLVMVLVGLCYWLAGRKCGEQLVIHPATVCRLVAVTLAVLGCFLLLDGVMAMVFLAVTGLALVEISRRDGGLAKVAGHALLLVAVFWMLGNLAAAAIPPVLVNARALGDLLVIGILIFVAVRSGSGALRGLYWIAGQTTWLLWLLRELGRLPEGSVWVTSSWGVYALALLLGAVLSGSVLLRRTGVVILAITLGKLFLVDMTTVDPLWRIVLFLGLGGAFLLASIWLPALGGRHGAKRG